jgi:acylphosphatase
VIQDLRATFSGQVQGVGFRAETCALARDYMIDGWVKNLPDGRVEVLARGEEAEVRSFLRGIQKSRLASHIDGMEQSLEEPSPEVLSGFIIKY